MSPNLSKNPSPAARVASPIVQLVGSERFNSPQLGKRKHVNGIGTRPSVLFEMQPNKDNSAFPASLVIPTRNRRRELRELFLSVQKQTVPLEIMLWMTLLPMEHQR